MKNNALKIFGIYLLLTLVTTFAMRDFSPIHTILLLVDSIMLVVGAALYRDEYQYYKVFSLVIAVLGSIFLIRALTPTLLRIWEVTAYLSFIFALTNLILIVIALLPKHIFKRGLGIPLMLVIFFPIAVCWGYYFSEYSWMNVEAVMAIMQSNIAESIGYIKEHTGIGGYIATIVYLLLAVICCLQAARLELKSGKKTFYCGIGLFVILNTILLIRSTQHNFLTTIYVEVKQYQANYDQFEREREIRKSMLASSLDLERSGNPGVYVLVIGESQNKTHMSAYGYVHPTTPVLDDLETSSQAIFFQNAFSCHVQTVPALTYALTAKNQYNDYPLDKSVSLLEIAEAAGFNTVWISNQVKLGAWGTPTAVIADEADQQIWLNEHATDTLDASYFDEEVVNRLDSIQTSDKMLIILHFMGSHSPYRDRYPANFDRFKGDDKVSEYDNSIYYNDYVMGKLLEKLKNMPNFKAMIYFSDHSEGINYGEGHHPSTFIYDMAYIPFYMYFSSDYIDHHNDVYVGLRNYTDAYFTNDLIFNTVLGIMDIREKNIYEPNNDLTSTKYDKNRNRFMTMHGQRRIAEDVK